MIKQVLAAAFAAALISLPVAPVSAATAEQAPAAAKKPAAAKPAAAEKKAATPAAAKKLTPQQQKMKDCGPKWAAYKKEKNVKGRAEYQKFLKTCLKKT